MSSFSVSLEEKFTDHFLDFLMVFSLFRIGIGELRDRECCGESVIVASSFNGLDSTISADISWAIRFSRTVLLAFPIHFCSFVLTLVDMFALEGLSFREEAIFNFDFWTTTKDFKSFLDLYKNLWEVMMTPD